MFTLDPKAKYQGNTSDGLAIYAVDKTAAAPRKSPRLNAKKIAAAQAQHDKISALLGNY